MRRCAFLRFPTFSKIVTKSKKAVFLGCWGNRHLWGRMLVSPPRNDSPIKKQCKSLWLIWFEEFINFLWFFLIYGYCESFYVHIISFCFSFSWYRLNTSCPSSSRVFHCQFLFTCFPLDSEVMLRNFALYGFYRWWAATHCLNSLLLGCSSVQLHIFPNLRDQFFVTWSHKFFRLVHH